MLGKKIQHTNTKIVIFMSSKFVLYDHCSQNENILPRHVFRPRKRMYRTDFGFMQIFVHLTEYL